jgi:hypothetical protein
MTGDEVDNPVTYASSEVTVSAGTVAITLADDTPLYFVTY